MAFLVIRGKMKRYLKNSILFILAAAVTLLVISVFMAADPVSAIEVKGASVTQTQEYGSCLKAPGRI
jgi:hypothetical protein